MNILRKEQVLWREDIMCGDGKESMRPVESERDGEIVGMRVPVMEIEDKEERK